MPNRNLAKIGRAFALLVISFSSVCCGQAAGPANVSRFMRAAQSADYRVLIDLTSPYAQAIAQIKTANPQSLWTKIIGEYYEKQTAALKVPESNYWVNYGQRMAASAGDPVLGIKDVVAFMATAPRWRITETRPPHLVNDMFAGRIERGTVYVAITYPSPESSPIVNSKVVKEALFEFTTERARQLIGNVARVPQGDVFWTGETPAQNVAIAKRLVQQGMPVVAAKTLEPLYKNGTLPDDGKTVLAHGYYDDLAKNGFGRIAQWGGGALTWRLQSWDQWRPVLERALALDPSIREPWITLVIQKAAFNESQNELNDSYDMLQNSTPIAEGNPETASALAHAKVDLAERYLRQGTGSEGYVLRQDILERALRLDPNGTPARVVVLAKDALRIGVREIPSTVWNPGPYQEERLFNVLKTLTSLRIRIGPEDVPAFLEYAKYTKRSQEYEKGIRALALQ